MQNLINIAIFGQDRGAGGADDTRLIFTYPNPNASQMNEAWLRGLFDPRDARDLTNSENVYALWSSSEGNYYGVIVPANDGRNGRQLLCLHVGKRVSSSGRIVISTLNTLKSLLIDSNLRERSLIDSNLDELVNSLLIDNSVYQNNTKTAKAIRQYQTLTQLEQIFTFPKQVEYANYRCVYAISSSVTIAQQSSFALITSPIKVIYRVMGQIPEGISVDKMSITAGGFLNITYKKDGCEPVTKTVVVDGRYNSALYYVENEIYINDSQKAGVKFQRKVKLRFEDSSTHSMVRDVTIQLQGGRPTIANELTVNDQTSYQTTRIKVIKTGYKTRDIDIVESDILKGEKTILLEPKSTRTDLYIITPDGEQTSINTEVKETSALYRYVQHHGPYIHVKSNHRPDSNGGEGHKRDIDWWSILSYAIWGLIALILFYGGYAAYQLLINDKAPWPFGKEPVEVAQVADIQEGENQDGQIDEPDKQADLSYLKTNDDCWDKTQLKSASYQELIDFIAQGLIEQAFSHPYKDESVVNSLWCGKQVGKMGCVEIYEKIRNKISPDDISEAMRRSRVNSSSDKISVNELIKELSTLKSRVEPSSQQRTVPSETKPSRTVRHDARREVSTPKQETKQNKTPAKPQRENSDN